MNVSTVSSLVAIVYEKCRAWCAATNAEPQFDLAVVDSSIDVPTTCAPRVRGRSWLLTPTREGHREATRPRACASWPRG